MKTILSIFLFISFTTISFSQSGVGGSGLTIPNPHESDMYYVSTMVKDIFVNDVNLSDDQYKVVQFVDYGGLYGINFGQVKKRKDLIQQVIKDKDGKVVKFESAIEYINFLELNGWRHYLTYQVEGTTVYGGALSGTSYTIIHLFRKE